MRTGVPGAGAWDDDERPGCYGFVYHPRVGWRGNLAHGPAPVPCSVVPLTSAPLFRGAAATLLAAVQLCGWLGMGSLVTRDADGEVAVPVALLVGSAITAFVSALLCVAGHVDSAVAAQALLTLSALALARKQVARLLEFVLKAYRGVFVGSGWISAAASALLVLYWIDAVAPPRDADVMRYHLAHIGQIVQDGRWEAVADFHYALPFGWSLTYLPSVRLGIPETAHLLSLGLWVAGVASIVSWLKRNGASVASYLLVLALSLQPFVLKSVTTAHTDSYSILVFLAVGLTLARWAEENGVHNAGMLGFVAWVGAQSRYQMLGVGIAATVAGLLLHQRRARGILRPASAFIAGSLAATVLATPWYLMNWMTFGNPVWPLLVKPDASGATYADRVASSYAAQLAGSHAFGATVRSLTSLVRDAPVFPIPLLALLFVPAAFFFSRRPAIRALGSFAGLFFLLWLTVQPSLYPRFSLFFTPVVALGLGTLLGTSGPRRWVESTWRAGLGLLTIAFLASGIYYSADGARYLFDGDLPRFHRATWYYPVYAWINNSLPDDARLLVIVRSGQSYYLNRRYRRADPFLTGVVNWDSLRGTADLDRVLAEGRYSYLLYDRTDWSPYPGGSRMQQLLDDAIQDKTLIPERRFRVRLVASRLLGTSSDADVWLLRRAVH